MKTYEMYKLNHPQVDFKRASVATTFVLAVISAVSISRMMLIFGQGINILIDY